MIPVWTPSLTPQNFIRAGAWRRIPSNGRSVLQVLGGQAHIRGRRRSGCQGGESCGVQYCDVRDKIEIDKFRKVPVLYAAFGTHVLMLVIEVLAVFGKTHGSEALLVE